MGPMPNMDTIDVKFWANQFISEKLTEQDRDLALHKYIRTYLYKNRIRGKSV